MSDEMLRMLTWVGLGVGAVVVTMFLEVLLRTLTNRHGDVPDTQMLSRN
jgi:hypothetical protein